MSAWLRHHWTSLVQAFARLAAHPLATLLALVMIGTTFALPLGGYLLLEATRDLAGRVPGEPQLSVFLAPDATKADVERIGERLRREPAAARVAFIGKDEALDGLKRSLALGEAASSLRGNPLPDAFVVTLRARAPEPAERLAQALRAEPKVGHVLLDTAWLRRVDALLATASTLLGLLTTLLAVGVVAVIFGVVRAQVQDRKAEADVARLVGATERYIRRPLLYTGAVSGLLGAAVGAGLLHAGLGVLDPALRNLADAYGSNYSLPGFSWLEVAVTLALGTVLGVAGAALAAALGARARHSN